MTILATEIHPGANGGIIVFAADRRISRGTQPANDQRKIFRISDRTMGIGYFGLSEIQLSTGPQPMADWIQDFLYTVGQSETLDEIAHRLASSLNGIIPHEWHRSERSGFHIAGYNRDGQPEFWYVRNIDDSGELTIGRYDVREDFQRRDSSQLLPGQAQIYRNGDIRAHVTAWQRIDEAFGVLLGTPDFQQLRTTRDYLSWVRFKMETIARFYEQYSTRSIIGTPIDVFAFSVDGFEDGT